MDYLKSFFVSPNQPEALHEPRLPDLNPFILDTNTRFEIGQQVRNNRLVAIIVWSSRTYDELSRQQNVYDELLMSRARASDEFVYFKCDVEVMIKEEGGGGTYDGGDREGEEGKRDREERRKKGERAVRGTLGVHPSVVRETAAVSIFCDGKLIGSIEGDEMEEYGIVEKALNAVY